MKTMSPTEAIESLDEMLGAFNRFGSALRYEAEDIQERWAALGMAGGQRDDHAAELLSRLRNILRDAASFCGVAEDQITAMVRDPFQRGS